MFEEDLITRAREDTGLVSVVADRVEWGRRIQALLTPALVLHRITAGREYVMAGRIDLQQPLVQFDCWATTFTDAAALRDAVVSFLDTLNTAPFQGAFIQSERNDFDPVPGSAASDFHRISLDVRIWHRSIPA